MLLRELQQSFAADLWGENIQQLRGIVSQDLVSAERRLNVYRNNIRASLQTALAAMYPVTRQLVGSDFFRYLADQYIRAYPSRSGDLQEFARNIPTFLANFEPASTIPYLADVTTLEWAYQEVTRSPSPEPPDLGLLGKLAPHELPGLRFELGAACRLVTSPYPVFSIWRVNQNEYVDDDSVTLAEGSQTVLIVRPRDDVELWCLRGAERTFFDALVSGQTLGAAVDAMTLCGHDFNLESLLDRYVRPGVLVFTNIKNRPNGRE